MYFFVGSKFNWTFSWQNCIKRLLQCLARIYLNCENINRYRNMVRLDEMVHFLLLFKSNFKEYQDGRMAFRKHGTEVQLLTYLRFAWSKRCKYFFRWNFLPHLQSWKIGKLRNLKWSTACNLTVACKSMFMVYFLWLKIYAWASFSLNNWHGIWPHDVPIF